MSRLGYCGQHFYIADITLEVMKGLNPEANHQQHEMK